MTQKTALITGANKGIGFEAARQLGSKGFHIILSGRDAERVNKAAKKLEDGGVSVQPLIMDVGKLTSIQEAFSELRKTVQSIDVIINNAGILLDENTPLLQISGEDFLQTFSVNAFGAFFTVQTFLPMLRKGSRIINVSSDAGRILQGVSTWAPVYSLSKTTMNAITLQLAAALQPGGIAVNSMCPGWVKTDMGGSGASRSVDKGAETVVWLATETAQSLTGKFFRDKKEISW